MKLRSAAWVAATITVTVAVIVRAAGSFPEAPFSLGCRGKRAEARGVLMAQTARAEAPAR